MIIVIGHARAAVHQARPGRADPLPRLRQPADQAILTLHITSKLSIMLHIITLICN